MEQFQAALRNNRGQGLIESLAVSAALMAAVMILLGVIYFGFVHIGANYLLHELLICKATQGESSCEKTFRKRAESFLFAAKLLSIQSNGSFGRYRGHMVLKMPMNKTLTIKKELSL